jgi:hypothetical protein
LATRFGGDRIEGRARQAVGVLGEPEPVFLCRGDEPLEEIHPQTKSQAPADDAHLGQEIPNVGPLERGCDNEKHRAVATLPPMVGAQPGGGELYDDSVRRLLRSQTNHVERPADLPPRVVDPFRKRREHQPDLPRTHSINRIKRDDRAIAKARIVRPSP